MLNLEKIRYSLLNILISHYQIKTYKEFVMSIAQSIKHQDRLLTINVNDGEIENALPGVHVTPCF